MKFAILAILEQGPAYGLLIRNELQRRQERTRPINVGQVYNTIDRLVRDGLARQSHATPDGLPLYVLTDEGTATLRTWVMTPHIDAAKPWDSMLMQVLLVRSLPGHTALPLIRAYETWWQEELAESATSHNELSRSARQLLARSALEWLRVATVSGDAPIEVLKTRPPRGRPVQ